MLEKTVPIVGEKKVTPSFQFEIPAEEEIAEIQLQKLRDDSRKRKLTLEETRQYDLLVKNKRLSQEKSTVNLEKSNYREVTEADLLKIASKPEKDGK